MVKIEYHVKSLDGAKSSMISLRRHSISFGVGTYLAITLKDRAKKPLWLLGVLVLDGVIGGTGSSETCPSEIFPFEMGPLEMCPFVACPFVGPWALGPLREPFARGSLSSSVASATTMRGGGTHDGDDGGVGGVETTRSQKREMTTVHVSHPELMLRQLSSLFFYSLLASARHRAFINRLWNAAL